MRRTEVRRTRSGDADMVRWLRPKGEECRSQPTLPRIKEKTIRGTQHCLNEPRAKVVVAMRNQLVRRSSLRRPGCNEIDAVRLASP